MDRSRLGHPTALRGGKQSPSMQNVSNHFNSATRNMHGPAIVRISRYEIPARSRILTELSVRGRNKDECEVRGSNGGRRRF
jgi:hypothetical protein